MVPPPLERQAPRVGVNPTPPVSRLPPRARPHRVCIEIPARALPEHVSVLALHHFSPPTLVPQAGILGERLTFCGPPRCRPMPGPSRALARAADPPVAAHRGGMLAPAAGAAAAPVAIARAALTALRVLARAGLFLRKVRARGGTGAPPPPRRRPPHRRAPALRAPDTLSTPLPSLTPPSPSSLPSQLTPPSPLTPLVNPYFPTRCTNPRAVAPSLL